MYATTNQRDVPTAQKYENSVIQRCFSIYRNTWWAPGHHCWAHTAKRQLQGKYHCGVSAIDVIGRMMIIMSFLAGGEVNSGNPFPACQHGGLAIFQPRD